MNDQSDMNRGFLKDKLGDYRADPPEKVWEEISGQLGKGRNRRGIYVLLLAAASLALALTLGIHFFGPDLSRRPISREELPADSSPQQADSGEDRTIAPPANGPEELPQPGPVMAMKQERGNEPLPEDAPVVIPGPGPETGGEAPRDVEVETLPETRPLAIADTGLEAEGDAAPQEGEAETIRLDSAAESGTEQFPFVEPDNGKASRWTVGAAVSPLYSYRDAASVSMPAGTAESGILSYSTGVHVSYRRNSRLAIETGVYYNKTGLSIGAPGIRVFSKRLDYMNYGTGSQEALITTISNTVGNIVAYSGDIYMNGYKINAENGPAAYDNMVPSMVESSESGIQQHLDYLEVPFNLRYSVIDRTIELQLVGGISTNFLVGNYVTADGASGPEDIGYLSNINKFNYSGNAGLGMIYHMGGKLSLMVEPRFRYFLNSVNDSSLPATRPYSIGLYTGLNFTF
jgi:hypothetical protein